MAKNAVCNWDFTLKDTNQDIEELKSELRKHCKNWTFQKEQGKETGYIHFQGRVSLKLKARKPPLFQNDCHWSITSNDNKDNLFYVMKDDTKIAGPWSDKDKIVYIPRQFRDIKLYKWQKKIADSANIFDARKIDLIYDPSGNSGKSTIASLCELLYGGIDMPPLNDFKELIALLCDICMEKEIRDPKIIFFDMPRALDKDRLYGMYSAIEQVKKGKVYDCRYKYKDWWIDSPRIWVFSNQLPDQSLLSNDRWNIWTINNQTEQLEPFSMAVKPVTIRKRII